MNIKNGIDKINEFIKNYETEEGIPENEALFLKMNLLQLREILKAMEEK